MIVFMRYFLPERDAPAGLNSRQLLLTRVRGRAWSDRAQGLNCQCSPSDPTELRQRAVPSSASVSPWALGTSRYLTAPTPRPPPTSVSEGRIGQPVPKGFSPSSARRSLQVASSLI